MESSFDEEREMINEPFLKNSRKGGFRTLPFILANETLEKVASYGITPNMPLYLINEYHMEMTTSSNILFYWSAAINFMPVIGAIIADSYVGRFNMIVSGSVLSCLGMVLLWLTAAIPGARPSDCNESVNYCSPTTIPQLLLLCTSFIVIAIGVGGIRSTSVAFGVDQLENENRERKGGFLERYFSWYTATYNLGILIAFTGIVYILDKMGWKFGFGVCVLVMLLSALTFFLGIPFYENVKTKGNLIIDLTQVIVASCKNRRMQLSSENENMIYYSKKGSSLMYPTVNLRFLNKACIIQNAEQELAAEGTAIDPWRLCTVDQVEDLKVLLKVIPLWSTGMLTYATMSLGSFSILQATSMNRKVTASFEIPAGSFGSLTIISLILWVTLYDQMILPIASIIRGKPVHFSTKQRMGAGIFLSCICMIITAVVEGIRRNLATKEGLSDFPDQMVQISALWLVPQYCLTGIAQGLNGIAQSEFYVSEFPKHMSSIASTLCMVGMSVGNILASFLMSTIDALTKVGGQESWISTNINKGHYDYYFLFLSGLSILNFMYFLLCCWIYGPCRDANKAWDEEDILG